MDFESFVVEHARMSKRAHKRLKLDDTLSFFHHLSTLVAAGTPLLQALRICAEQTQSIKLRKVLDDINFKVGAGSALHAAAAAHPEVFADHWIEIIRTGEVTGKMASVLIDLNKQISDSRETRRKVMAALMYPMVLMVIAVIAITIMLWMVVPTFAQMFKEMGAELPDITKTVVGASDFVAANGPYLLPAVVLAIVGIRMFARTERGRRCFIGCGLMLPVSGELLINSAMYRFASSIALMLKSGVPMLETIQTLICVFQQNPMYRNAMLHTQGAVASGRPLATALEDTRLFTNMMISMVRVGEESGELGNVMEQVAPYYKEKMETAVLRVTKLLEPVIIMGMGVTIAGVMLSIYMPMFEMSGKIH